MPTLADVFRELNALKDEGVVEDYALGGAVATLFYAEAVRTYDVDVFVLVPGQADDLVTMSEVYAWAKRRGYSLRDQHILIHGTPVQFLGMTAGLEADAIRKAREFDYEGVTVRVMPPVHLAALYVLAGGAARRTRAAMLLDAGVATEGEIETLLRHHGRWDDWQTAWKR